MNMEREHVVSRSIGIYIGIYTCRVFHSGCRNAKKYYQRDGKPAAGGGEGRESGSAKLPKDPKGSKSSSSKAKAKGKAKKV